MAGTVIVALPAVDEKVYKISSEKVPHLTLAYLGEDVPGEDLATIVTYVQHAASELSPFYMSVDYRGELGPDQADVLFFEKSHYDIGRIAGFRHHLLLNDTLKRYYDSVQQYPEWTPHLTLGYPEAPAKEDDSDNSKFYSVSFDRIAVWVGDSEGPEFRLKYDDYGMGDVAMSDMTTAERGAGAIAELFHYGKKGMKWGVRTTDRAAQKTPTEPTVNQEKPGKFAKAEGGQHHPLHPDSEAALKVRQIAKGSTTDALSNVELRQAVERMQLEQKFSQLEFQNDRRSKGQRFVQGLFGKRKPTKYIDVHEEAGSQTGDAVKKAIAARAAIKAAQVAAAAA